MKKYLSLVKFSHTIFALPFALIGFFMGIRSHNDAFPFEIFLYVLFCMIFARSAAMAFNRYIDRDIDALNPRTTLREIPAGIISPRSALVFTLINVFLFIGTCFLINTLCFLLSPIAILVILGYSYAKRYTFLCHLILGLGLSLAPVGAYVAVTNSFSVPSVLYGFVVLFWVAGFDIIYALQDDDFDRSNQLHSIPANFGRGKALTISKTFHTIAAIILLVNAYYLWSTISYYSPIIWIASILFIASLVYQHKLISESDLSRVNQAFFLTNGIASIVFGLLMNIEILW